MKISVIIPVYNAEQYLQRCVDSVFSQTFEDYELILVDDGSKDKSGQMCEGYAGKDERVRVIHKENGGLSSARNAGMDIAIGEYLFFLDSDDCIHRNCLKDMLECVVKSGADLVIGGMCRFSGDIPPQEKIEAIWSGEYHCKTNLETLGIYYDGTTNVNGVVSSCGKLIRRELYGELRFPEGRLFEDEFVTYRVIHRAERVAFIDMVYYFYYDNHTGITRTLTLQKRMDEYDAQWERLQYYREQRLTELYDQALLTFLRVAKWDIVACRKGEEAVDDQRKKRFIGCFKAAFSEAERKNLLDPEKDFDYYMLAKPQLKFWWKLKRLWKCR